MKLDIQRFAVTKSTNFSEPTLTNDMIINNKSSLSITISFSANNSVTFFSGKTLSCTCNGVTKTASVSHSKGGSVTKTFTFENIQHNNDGTKTVAWSWSCNTGTSVLGTISASGNRTLQVVPRASAIDFDSDPAELGSALTISLTKYIEGSTDELSFEIGDTSGVIGTTDQDMYIWTPPITLADEITDSTTKTCLIYCTTYDGDTLIGTSTATLTLEVPSSVVPSVSIGTLTEADVTMQSLDWGVFVQNKSKLNIPITATGIYDSQIQSIVTTINGLNFTGTPVVTPTLVTPGTNTITTTVTDSRGRTATDTKTYTVVAYSNPNIEVAQVQRCLYDGTLSDNGTYLLYDFKGSISNVSNNNSALFRIGYKLTTASTYTYVTISTNYSINLEDQISSFTISSDYPYDIVFEATDEFMISQIDRNIDTGFDIFNFHESGKAMAIGKVSEAGVDEELLEIALPTEFLNDVSMGDITCNDIASIGDITAVDITASGDLTSNTITSGTGTLTTLSVGGNIIERRNVLNAKPENDTTLTSTNATKIVLEENQKIGTRLSIYDGGIKIGSGVTKVLVSANILFSTGGDSATRKGLQIHWYDSVNNTTDLIIYNSVPGGTYVGSSIAPYVLDVQEDDIIYLYGLNQGQQVQ